MVYSGIRNVLPRAYRTEGAGWYGRIKKDYESYNFKVLLVSYIFAVNIPAVFLAYDLFHGRKELLLNYLIPAAVLLLLIAYLVVFRNVRVMRIVSMLTALVGLFCAALLPGAHGVKTVIIINFIPITFALFGIRAGLKWVFFFILSLLVLGAVAFSGAAQTDMSTDLQTVTVSSLSVLIMFAILYSSQKQHERVMKSLVKGMVFDPVTALPNRESFLRCGEDMEHSIVAILHITNFKRLTILFGYSFSEYVLFQVARTLREIALRRDFDIYKLGWNEFGIQIPCSSETTASNAWLELYKILRPLMNRKFKWENAEVSIAFHMGGVICRDGVISGALSKADAALSTGLRKKRNLIIYEYDMNLSNEILDTVNRYNTVYANIMNNSFRAFLQPVVSTETGKVCWYESLLRVMNPQGGYDSVWNYLPVARDSGLYSEFTDFILDHAASFLRDTDHSLSVNLSFNDIQNREVFEKVKRISMGDFYREGRLILEIVENEDLADLEMCMNFVRQAQALGVYIAIDDFGSGYSNLSNVLNIGADIIKIDGELIRRVEYDDEALMLIASLTDFCRNTGKSMVAEYIENNSIYMLVREMGIEYCQGYFFGKPEDSEMLTGEGVLC